MGEKVGIKKIAELSGVSIGTVDRVLNNRKGVSKETAKHIRAVIKHTGYKKNNVASRLKLAQNKTDIVTGGGPGLMEAANSGAKDGSSDSKSFGLHIDLPFETTPNDHLDITYHHKKFSSRLDEFMRISHAVIVTPGGIGTILELLYTWQLIQVNHISSRPIILVGEMWDGLIDWMRSEPLNKKLIDKTDFDNIEIVQNVDEVIALLQPHINKFYKNN